MFIGKSLKKISSLKSQIASNLEKKCFDQQMSLKEAIWQKDREDQMILLDLDQNERQKVNNIN